MAQQHILSAIKQLNRQIFTTREIAFLRKSTLSNTTQTLSGLAKAKVIIKIYRGIWGIEFGKERISRYSIIPFLTPQGRSYLSFTSALHLYGIIEQIPQVVTLAFSGHSRRIHTALGDFELHRLAPGFFKGFDWYKIEGKFLIADPEKAFVDCLYLSARKSKQFGSFPELHFPSTFKEKKVWAWTEAIPDIKIRTAVKNKLKAIFNKEGEFYGKSSYY